MVGNNEVVEVKRGQKGVIKNTLRQEMCRSTYRVPLTCRG